MNQTTTSDVGLGETAAYAAGQPVSFRGSYSGKAAMGTNGSPVFGGTGIATHLGNSTCEGYATFTTDSASSAGGISNDNYETLTAANGDSFTIVTRDVACATGPGQFHGSGDWDVVPGSGTGRFTGVTGHGKFDGHTDFMQGVFDMELTGTISAGEHIP
jgi:hypothetical protein